MQTVLESPKLLIAVNTTAGDPSIPEEHMDVHCVQYSTYRYHASEFDTGKFQIHDASCKHAKTIAGLVGVEPSVSNMSDVFQQLIDHFKDAEFWTIEEIVEKVPDDSRISPSDTEEFGTIFVSQQSSGEDNVYGMVYIPMNTRFLKIQYSY